MSKPVNTIISEGIRQRGMATAIIAGLQLMQLFFLARWLPPRVFGVYAILRTIIGFGGYFSDAGMYNAILYGKPMNPRLFSTIYWISIGVGGIMFSLLYGIAPWLAEFYSMPELVYATKYIGFALLLMAIGGHYKAVLQRDLHFKILAIIDIISHIAGVFTALLYAYYYQDVMALVWGYLIKTSTASLGYILSGYRRHPISLRLSSSGLRYYLRYAAYQLPERWLGYLNSNMDVLIIGRLLGSDILGVYELFKQFLRRGEQTVNPLLDHVFVPVMATLHRAQKAIAPVYLRMVRWSAYVLFPFYLLLFIEADIFIKYFFGDQWSPYTGLFRWLCIYFIVHSVVQHIGAWWVSTNRPELGFYWNLGLFPVIFGVVFLGARMGIEELTMLLTALMLLQGVLLYWTMMARDVKIVHYVRSFTAPLLYTVLCFSPLMVMKWLAWGGIVGQVVATVILIVIYTLLVFRTTSKHTPNEYEIYPS